MDNTFDADLFLTRLKQATTKRDIQKLLSSIPYLFGEWKQRFGQEGVMLIQQKKKLVLRQVGRRGYKLPTGQRKTRLLLNEDRDAKISRNQKR